MSKFLKAYTLKQAMKIMADAHIDYYYGGKALCATLDSNYLYDGKGFYVKWHGLDILYPSRSFKFEIYDSLYNIPSINEDYRFILRRRFDGCRFIRDISEFNIIKSEIQDEIKSYIVRDHNKQIEKDLSILDDDESQPYKTNEDQMNEFMELLSKWVESQTY